MITMVISSWWRWWKRNMHSRWEVNGKGVSLLNVAKKALSHFWLSFHDRLVYEDKVCSILVKIMITTLWMFYSCFEWLFHTRAAPAEHCFPSKFFFFPLSLFNFARSLFNCSTGHSLSKTAPSTHLHVCAGQNYFSYAMYNCCTRRQALLTESVFQKLCLNLSKCAIFCASGVCVPTHPIATLPQSQR